MLAPELSSAEEIVINAVGDIMLAGRWTSVFKKKGYDFPFAGIRAELSGADINLANLESPIARSGKEYTKKKFRFLAAPEVARALAGARFNLVTLANNHSMDYSRQALLETMANLDASGVNWIGAGTDLNSARMSAYYRIKGKIVAFLGYSLTQPVEFFASNYRAGTAPGWEHIYSRDIKVAKARADYVVVSFHWGKEGQGSVADNQRFAAHRAIDAGADVIIGHHPHVLQGVECYNKGIIFYSLGNFAFASMSHTAEFGALVKIRLDNEQREAEIVPLDVLNSRVFFQPQVLTGLRADAVIANLNTLSKPFDTVIQRRDGRYYISF